MNIEDSFKLWKEACIAYYNTDEPIMSDQEFDSLTEELNLYGTEEMIRFMNSHITGSGSEFIEITPNEDASIGQQVSLKKIKWQSDMNIPEIVSFLRRGKPDIKTLYISPKFDGCSININLTTDIIKTRGGQDVTNKLRYNQSIMMWSAYFKKRLQESAHKTEVICGELVIDKKVFKDKYSDVYKNERNFVAGCLNGKTSQEVMADLTFCPYTDGVNPVNSYIIPLVDGSRIPCWTSIDSDMDSLQKFDLPLHFKKLRENMPYLIDGIVIGYETDKRIIVDNYPLNMVAVKFRSETAVSKVVDIQWTQKKSDKLNPIVIIEPVQLMGTTVTKASAFNYEYIVKNHIGIGSEIEITKSGDIIPYIIRTIKKSDNIKYPDIDFIIDGKNLVCTEESDDSIRTKFYNALVKLEIKGIGQKTSDIIGEIVNFDILEIFNPEHKIDFISKLGYDSANWRIFQQVYKIKELTLSDLIYMLQFRQVGATIALKISRIITKQSNDISNISQDILQNVCRGEGFQRIKNSMTKLKDYGVKVIKDYVDGEFITYEMTGEPPQGTKEDHIQRIKKIAPNSQHTTLTKTTKYLITNDINSNTSKMTKARKYNIRIITYQQSLNPEIWK